MSSKQNIKYVTIEPFFDQIISAIKKVLFAIIKGILSPVINVLKKLAKIIVDFIAEKVLKPIFTPIGIALEVVVFPLKLLFAFIGKILDFIVLIIKFIFKIINTVLSLPFKILESIGIISRLNKEPLDTISDNIGSVSGMFTESANNVNKVINKNNMKIFLTILVLSIFFISIYYFYEDFDIIFEKISNFFNSVFYPSKEE